MNERCRTFPLIAARRHRLPASAVRFCTSLAITVAHNLALAASPPTVISVWGGARTCIALMSDGVVWQWGTNNFGVLGDATTTERHTPVQVHGPADAGFLHSISAVMGGEPYNFALKNDGTVWTWGWNALGSLGDGTNTESHVPVQVRGPGNIGFLTSIVGLGGRGYHSVALRADGTVWSWGNNGSGQLADGTKTNSNVPLQIGGLAGAAAATAVTGGYTFSMALKSDHTLWAWGGNANGELGDGTNTPRTLPVQVQGLNNVLQASSGWKHAVAVQADGTVWTWGKNDKGQLGDGLTANRNQPYQVAGLSHVIAVSGGDCHTTALKDDGTVWTWGCYGRTQVDPNTITDSVHPFPVQVPGLTGVVKHASRDYHNIAVKSDGTVWTWGWNINGQLGDGTTIDSEIPVQVIFPAVVPAAQSIGFGAAPVVSVGGTGMLSASATSDLPVVFSSATPATCTVSGSTVTGTGVGVCSIAADQPGNTNFSAALQATQSFDVSAVVTTLDIDLSVSGTQYDALTDGLLVLRYLSGVTGPALTAGALGATATRTDPSAIKNYLDGIRSALDIDGNGTTDALTDGMLVLRYLFGFRGDALISGVAIDPMGARRTAPAIEDYLKTLVP